MYLGSVCPSFTSGLGEIIMSEHPDPGMATTQQVATLHKKWSLKRLAVAVFWCIVVVLALQFLFRFVARYASLDENVYGRFWPHRGYLIPHLIGGTIALLSGPFQFWSGLRRRALVVHRWIGRAYLTAILVAATNAFYLACFVPADDGGWMNGASLLTLGMFWLVSSGMAYLSIRNRRVQAHKEWMIRSYVLTFFFVNARLWPELPIIRDLGTPMERSVITTWLAWILPLFVAEVLIQWKNVRRPALARPAGGRPNQ